MGEVMNLSEAHTEELALEYNTRYEGLDREAIEALSAKYSIHVRYRAKRIEIEERFEKATPQIERTCTVKHGSYELEITPYDKTGGFMFSRGVVSRNSEAISTVHRNYGAFPFHFITNHKNGHHYLVCGEDYQGQTIIELDTGRRWDLFDEDGHKGWGFCWASYTFRDDLNIMVVNGCRWAWPYEYRLYDFSDPPNMRHIDVVFDNEEIECEYLEYFDSSMPPSFEPDKVVRFYQTMYALDDSPGYAATLDFEMRQGKLFLIDRWVSPDELKRRRR